MSSLDYSRSPKGSIMRISILLSSVILLGSAQLLSAKSNHEVSCPEAITTTESISSVPAGWVNSQSSNSHPWQAITFYDGHPKDMASLAPEKSNKKEAMWHFATKRERDIYISCGYHRSGIELIQVLPKNINSCVVFYDRNSYGEQGAIPQKIVCAS